MPLRINLVNVCIPSLPASPGHAAWTTGLRDRVHVVQSRYAHYLHRGSSLHWETLWKPGLQGYENYLHSGGVPGKCHLWSPWQHRVYGFLNHSQFGSTPCTFHYDNLDFLNTRTTYILGVCSVGIICDHHGNMEPMAS